MGDSCLGEVEGNVFDVGEEEADCLYFFHAVTFHTAILGTKS